MIDESTIDNAIEWTSANLETATQNLATHFPALINNLFSGKYDLLTQEENELMLFLFIVIGRCTEEITNFNFDIDAYQKQEEINWELFENNKNLSWEQKLNHSFENYEQEDLLAFVEDMLTEDENPKLTNIGKEFIFVSVKSFIDLIKE